MVYNSRKWVGYSLFRLITLVGAIVALQACSAFKSDALLFIDVARQSVSAGPVLPTPSTGLDLKYRYLMVQVVGEPAAMLVLSTEYNTPNGLLEVWVAADGNLVQTLNGRLASAAGLSTQWSSVRWIGVPVEDAGSVVFGSVASGGKAVQRIRDVLPAYAYNVADTLQTEKVDFALIPRTALPSQADLAHWAQYVWLRERVATNPGSMAPGDSWIALGMHRGRAGVVASYQCLASALCLKTARWPLAQADASNTDTVTQ